MYYKFMGLEKDKWNRTAIPILMLYYDKDRRYMLNNIVTQHLLVRTVVLWH